MKSLDRVKRQYERLFVAIIITILITVSMAGVAYSAVKSDVINTDNSIKFTRIGGEITIVSDNLKISAPEIISVGDDGKTILSYNIVAKKAILSSRMTKLNVEGPFCINFVKSFAWQERMWVDGDSNEMSNQPLGYYTIVDPDPELVQRSIENIVSGDIWIENYNVTVLEFSTVSHIPINTVIYKIVFRNSV